MKLFALLVFVVTISSSFADVHCDSTYQTELHSSNEKVLGTQRFTNSSDCLFAAAAANERNSSIACAPYVDSTANGYSVYRLLDGKDLGNAVFKSFTDCQFSVLFAFEDVFCAPYEGKFAYWLIDENKQYRVEQFDTLQACIVESKNL